MSKISYSTNKGFTLLEMIFGVGLFVLLLLAVTSFGRSIFVYNSVSQNNLKLEQDTRIFFNAIGPEIRSLAPSNTGSYPIVAAATSSFTFYSDPQGDGLRRQIRYFLSNGVLKKGVITPTGSPLVYNSAQEVVTTIASNVANATSTPIFDYYPSSYAGTTTPLSVPVSVSLVRHVRVTLQFRRSRVPVNAPLISFTTALTMRNLKDNI